MSLGAAPTSVLSDSFPRVSGDEPHSEGVLSFRMAFSPRERG